MPSSRFCLVGVGALGVAWLLAGAAGWRSDSVRTHVIGYQPEPHLIQETPGGQPTGFLVDLLEDSARRANIRLRWVHVPEGAEHALENGQAELWPYLHNKEHLRRKIHFSRPYLRSDFSLLHLGRPGGRPEEGARVGIGPGSLHSYLIARMYSGVQAVELSGEREAIAKLCAGEVDFALIRSGRAALLVEEWPSHCSMAEPKQLALSSPEFAVSIAAAPGAAGTADVLRGAMDEALAEKPLAVWRGSYGIDDAIGGAFHHGMGSRPVATWIMFAILAAAGWAVRTAYVSRRRLRASEEERNRLRVELRNAEEAKTQLMANVSHEFFTPLNGVLGGVDLLKDSHLDPNQADLVETVHQSGRRLLALLTQLLEFSKLDVGRDSGDNRPFSLQEIVETLAQLSCRSAAGKGVDFLLRIDPVAPVWLRGDPQRLRRILEPIVQNAVKFTDLGRVSLAVLAGRPEEGEAVRIEIADTGPGISSERQKGIFDAFEQGDMSMTRANAGLGLGLTMAARLARGMGGRITLISEAGEGARFTIHLPVSMNCPVPAGQSPFRPNRHKKARRRVVVIHTDPDVRESIRVTVAAAGYGVVALESLPAGGLVGSSISHIFVEESQLELRSPSWPPKVNVVLLYPRGVEQRAVIPGRSAAEIASPFLPSEVRHLLSRGAFAFGEPAGRKALGEYKDGTGLGLHVLLVDDSRTNLKIAEQILRRMGCAVTTAENGNMALEALGIALRLGTPVDVVLMDCQMPVMDGYEATRRIRASLEPYHSTPVIALTAHHGHGERELCLASGMSDYTTKPISRQALWRMFQRHAGNLKGRRNVQKMDGCTKLAHTSGMPGHMPTPLAALNEDTESMTWANALREDGR
ncbi:MAG: response regulator [Bryobacterales bacterium]|nr:response regulator [Bryobacterales bacterium]